MVKRSLLDIFFLIALMWAVFMLDRFAPFESFGLRPRSIAGLPGIVAMPLLHADLRHLLSNTLPLIVLMLLIGVEGKRALRIVIAVTLVSGVLLWCFGRSAVHIGASGVVFGLAAYLIAGGYRPRSVVSLALAAITVMTYGGSLLAGVIPVHTAVSWDGHLSGAVAGVALRLLAPKALGPAR